MQGIGGSRIRRRGRRYLLFFHLFSLQNITFVCCKINFLEDLEIYEDAASDVDVKSPPNKKTETSTYTTFLFVSIFNISKKILNCE